MRGVFFLHFQVINLHLKILINPRTTKALEQTTRLRYRTRLQTRKMTEESDARLERLEKASQNQQGQMAEMMEMLRTLVRDKAQATGQRSGTTQLEQRREDPVYPSGFAPPYA